MNTRKLKAYIEQHAGKSLIVKPCTTIDGVVVKYNRKVFWEQMWDEYNIHCRGIVVSNTENRVLQHPFEKIFNHGEKQAPKLSEMGETLNVVEKINGYMAAATYDKKSDTVLVTTTGTDDSWYATEAKRMLPDSFVKFLKSQPDFTHILEIVSPHDPHFIEHKYGVHYLGKRLKGCFDSNHPTFEDFDKDMDEVLSFCGNDIHIPNYFFCGKDELLELVKLVKHEGFVVWNDEGEELKIKTPYYLFLKFFSRKRANKLDEILSSEESVLSKLDDDFQCMVPFLIENREHLVNMDEQQRVQFLRTALQEKIYG